jgi:hypothetical protein
MRRNVLTGVLCLALLCGKAYAQTGAADASAIIKKTKQMKEFSLLIRVPVTYSNEQAKAVNPEWVKVLDKWKADGVYVISFVFPGESYVVSGTERTVKQDTVVSDNLRVVSNIFLRAESMNEVIALAKACPILEHGGTVEIRACQPRQPQPGN